MRSPSSRARSPTCASWHAACTRRCSQREGLAAALQAGANRSTVPVELDLRLPERLSPELEAAAYYICAEAATNTIKHASASQVWLSAIHDNGTLTVIVRDDGVGGACVECGEDQATGLGGLKDRVEALGGVLEVESPEGEGTLPHWRPSRCGSARDAGRFVHRSITVLA